MKLCAEQKNKQMNHCLDRYKYIFHLTNRGKPSKYGLDGPVSVI